MTGQVPLDSHVILTVDVAVALVNALAPRAAGGRPTPPPPPVAALPALAAAALHDAGSRATDLDVDAAAGLRRLADRLRQVFDAVDRGREDDAAALLNDLLADSGARPHLHRHPPEPWHLHFHAPDAGVVAAWTAGCATGLAATVASPYVDRLGTCAAPVCDRVYLDVSRNGSRRFCSTACQNRVKAAAHRARRRGPERS